MVIRMPIHHVLGLLVSRTSSLNVMYVFLRCNYFSDRFLFFSLRGFFCNFGLFTLTRKAHINVLYRSLIFARVGNGGKAAELSSEAATASGVSRLNRKVSTFFHFLRSASLIGSCQKMVQTQIRIVAAVIVF